MLDPYITRAAGIAILGNTSSTIWISDGGRSGVRDEDVSWSAAIRPGFTAVNYMSPPVLNLRFKTLAAGYRYTCGQDVGTQHLRCWGQREAFGEAVTNGVLGAFAVGQNHVCYQVSDRGCFCYCLLPVRLLLFAVYHCNKAVIVGHPLLLPSGGNSQLEYLKADVVPNRARWKCKRLL